VPPRFEGGSSCDHLCSSSVSWFPAIDQIENKGSSRNRVGEIWCYPDVNEHVQVVIPRLSVKTKIYDLSALIPTHSILR
jgi:hypothetical protein